MGLPIPIPPVLGPNCTHCDDICWPAGQTPQFIHLEFAGLQFCGGSPLSPPIAIWVLEQNAVQPCFWEYLDDKFYITVEVAAGFTEVGCSGPPPGLGWNFFFDQKGPCVSDFVNDYTLCVGNTGSINGTAHVTWS